MVRRRVRLRIGYGLVRGAESHHGDTARVRRWQQRGTPQRESERAAERVAHQVERHAATVGDGGCNPRCAGCNPRRAGCSPTWFGGGCNSDGRACPRLAMCISTCMAWHGCACAWHVHVRVHVHITCMCMACACACARACACACACACLPAACAASCAWSSASSATARRKPSWNMPPLAW